MTTVINSSTYNIELRDKDGLLKGYLTPYVSKVSWEWNRFGGCGRCSITLNKAYRSITFGPRDDIQIRVPYVDTPAFVDLTNIDDEDMAAITDWADGDSGDGASTQATFDSKSTMKLLGGTAGANSAARSQDIGSFGKRTLFTMNLYFDKIGTFANNDYFYFDTYNGTKKLLVYFASDGLFVYDGASYNEVGTNLVVQDVWQKWAFDVDWDDGTVDIYLDNVLVGNNIDCNYSSAGTNGTVNLMQYCVTTASTLTYIDYFKAGSIPESKLVYRGFIANIIPTLKINQDIVLDVRGYFDLLKKIVIQDTGDVKTYVTSKISEIVDSITDTFITPNTPITKGDIEDGGYTTDIDSIDFLNTVDDGLSTLSQLAGDIEYGVDENLVFYWKAEGTSITHRFFVGDNITSFERRVNWDNLVNRIYVVGGDVAGTKYKYKGENTDSQATYYLCEEIINNSSIVTDGVAAQYCTAILLERATPRYSIRAKIANTNVRIEDTIPLGLISIYDADYDYGATDDLIGDIIGEAADGGSDIVIGETADGGSNVFVGGMFTDQIDRISYELSDTDGRFNIEIQLGDTALETSAKIKRLERQMASLTQY